MAAGTFLSAELDTAYEYTGAAGDCNLDEANGNPSNSSLMHH